MSKHTPGPWIVIGPLSTAGWGVCVAQDTSHDVSMIVARLVGRNKKEKDANARLIAAAPDLLAVLQELEDSAPYWSEYDVPIGIVDRIRAAIAKAKGKQP